MEFKLCQNYVMKIVNHPWTMLPSPVWTNAWTRSIPVRHTCACMCLHPGPPCTTRNALETCGAGHALRVRLGLVCFWVCAGFFFLDFLVPGFCILDRTEAFFSTETSISPLADFHNLGPNPFITNFWLFGNKDLFHALFFKKM